jgi:DNA-binding response OmpR family regulator
MVLPNFAFLPSFYPLAARRGGRPVNSGLETPLSLSVLVVEPHVDAADSLAELLQLAGHRVEVARTGASALDAAPADVVLLEVRLPDVDGWQLAGRFLAPGTPGKPLVVVLTTSGAEADHQRATEVGIDWFFVKPADPAQLLDFLARFAQRTACAGTGSDTGASPGA